MRNLLTVEMNLKPSDSKRHCRHKFVVGESATSLLCKFTYGPKELKDVDLSKELVMANLPKYLKERQVDSEYWERFLPLKNLLTISLDDPAEFRGAVHRQDAEQNLIIARNDASPGLLPGALPPGEWTVTVSVHCVVTDTCNYQLQIWDGELV